MSEALADTRSPGEVDGKDGNAAAIGVADFLYLAAAVRHEISGKPVFMTTASARTVSAGAAPGPGRI